MIIITNILRWIIVPEHYLPIVWGIVFLIIGAVIIAFKHRYEKETERVQTLSEQLEEAKLLLSLNNTSPKIVACNLGTHKFKTLNIYRKKDFNLTLHNAMIALLETWLTKVKGYTNYMSENDLEFLKFWNAPVLVIYPKGKKFFYHGDQNESRASTNALEIASNDIEYLYVDVDNQISMMEEPSNE